MSDNYLNYNLEKNYLTNNVDQVGGFGDIEGRFNGLCDFANADYLPASFNDLTGLNSPSIKPDIKNIKNISTSNFEKDLDISMNNKNLDNVQDWMDTSSVYVENSVEPFRGGSSGSRGSSMGRSGYGGMGRSGYGGMGRYSRYGSSVGTSPIRTKSQFRNRINNISSSQDIKRNISDKIVKNKNYYGGNNYYIGDNGSSMWPNINPLIFPAVIGGAAYSDYYNQNQPPINININNLAPEITKNEVQMETEIKTRNEVEMEAEQKIILEKLKNAKLKDKLQNNSKISNSETIESNKPNDSSNNFWIIAVMIVLILIYIFISNNKKLKNDTTLLTISNSSSNKLETTSFGF